MTDLLAARWTMAISLGFHIILAAVGMVMPWLMVLAHRRWLASGDEQDYRLTRAWGRGVAIFFATGAVSGTALSFELGVLWPGFMEHAGPIIGMPFSLEGAAFFVEAIALGIYLYGWGRIPPKVHLLVGVVIGMAGVSSGVLVISANGWMNSPTGFLWAHGAAYNIDPWAALMNKAWFSQSLHMVIASFEAVGFAVAGVHALILLRGNHEDPMHKRAFKLALIVGALAALLQPLSGHHSAQDVALRQPLKLAAMEAHFDTEAYAPLLIGGIPDVNSKKVRYALKVPGALSLLAFNDPGATVVGLDAFPKENHPPVLLVHLAFQLMVGLGTLLAVIGLFGLFFMRCRPTWLFHRWFLTIVAFATPCGFVAIEAGWVVTEVGRQPWIIYGVMKTADALTPVPGQIIHLIAFSMLYGLIGVSTVWMWIRQVRYADKLMGPTVELERWAFGGALS